MPGFDILLDAVQQVARSVPASGIDALCAALEGSPAGKVDRNGLIQSVTLPNHRMVVMSLLDRWQRDFTGVAPQSLALAIRSAAYGFQAPDQGTSEALVWTGPSAPGLRLRRIDQALLEVIDASQKELLLVTFAAYKVPLIVSALEAALTRGVQVRFVAETVEDSQGKISFDAAKVLGADLASGIQVYVWPFAKRMVDASGKHGSLHAKCAVADRSMLLMSSANLTDYALSLNMEMGLLITGGGLPSRVVDVFAHLIQNQTLVPL